MSRINDDAKRTHDIKLSVSLCDEIIGGRDFIVLRDGDFKIGDKLLFYAIMTPDMKTILNHEIIDRHAYITDVDILENGKTVVRFSLQHDERF